MRATTPTIGSSPSSAAASLGWVVLAPTSARACYAGVAENSVYVAADARGQRSGSRTHGDGRDECRERRDLDASKLGCFPENAASVALHESLGFRLVGRFERIAQLDGVWRDTILLELRLP